MKVLKLRSLIAGLALATVAAPSAQALTFDPGKVPPRTQMTVRYADGNSVSTGNGHKSRPALSLAKLYLGMWVLKYGAPEDKARVENMVRFSEDGTASDLERKYPQAIPSIIGEYRLGGDPSQRLLGQYHDVDGGSRSLYWGDIW